MTTDREERCVTYHSDEWRALVDNGWVTIHVDDDGVAFIIRSEKGVSS